MDAELQVDALEHFRNGYLRLRSALHDRTTRFPSYPLLFDELRTLLDARRHLGVVHVEPLNIDLVESLYGWQVFDRTMAQLAAVVAAMPGAELPTGTLLAVGGVPADRFVAFIPDAATGRALTHEDMAATAAAVKLRSAALDEERSPSWRPPRGARQARSSRRPVLPLRAAGRRGPEATSSGRRLGSRSRLGPR
jgi:hypothetical protein